MALAELSEAIGEEVAQGELRAALDLWREKALDIYAGTVRLAGPFPLPQPGEVHVETARSHVDWDAVRGGTNQGASLTSPRQWMRPAERAELDELEARLAEELRNRS